MTRVPVDWTHVNKRPYPLLGGNMKKVGTHYKCNLVSQALFSLFVFIFIIAFIFRLRIAIMQ